jgi:hypothetical protein
VFTPANLHKTYGGRLTLLERAAEALARAGDGAAVGPDAARVVDGATVIGGAGVEDRPHRSPGA